MNAALEILAEARRRGIVLAARGDQLAVDAPRAAFTTEFRDLLVSHKFELLALLRTEAEATEPPPFWREMLETWGPQESWWRRWRRRADELVAGLGPDASRADREAAEGRAFALILARLERVEAELEPPPEEIPPWPPRPAELASWPIELRQRWGTIANRYEAEGTHWRDAEQRAFYEIRAQLEVAE